MIFRRFVALALATVAVATEAACAGAPNSDQSTTDPTQSASPAGPLTEEDPRQRKPTPAIYEITGPGPMDITYDPGEGPEITEEKAELPWRTEVTVENRRDLRVTAVVPGFETYTEPFTCRIILDGEEVARESGVNTVSCFGF